MARIVPIVKMKKSILALSAYHYGTLRNNMFASIDYISTDWYIPLQFKHYGAKSRSTSPGAV